MPKSVDGGRSRWVDGQEWDWCVLWISYQYTHSADVLHVT